MGHSEVEQVYSIGAQLGGKGATSGTPTTKD